MATNTFVFLVHIFIMIQKESAEIMKNAKKQEAQILKRKCESIDETQMYKENLLSFKQD